MTVARVYPNPYMKQITTIGGTLRSVVYKTHVLGRQDLLQT